MSGVRIAHTPAAPPPVIPLDAAQAQVVAHAVGPLLVLGAPGTGKTSTLVEAVAARVRSGVPAESILVLAFGRRAATSLRDRIAARIGGGALPLVTTFHGFAYALVRRAVEQDPDATIPRLLSGAEEDVRVRELLLGAVNDGSIVWPDDLAPALPTLGLANEVRALLAHARERGLSPAQLADAGARLGHDVWEALAQFAEMEDEVLALEGLIDYGRLIELATAYVASDDLGPALRGSLQAVYVDDAQEADPAQARLLEALTTRRSTLVAFSDPDRGIYGFRGADRARIISLLQANGSPIVVLDRVHRGGPVLRAAVHSMQRGDVIGQLPAAVLRDYRNPDVANGVADAVDVRVFDSASDLAAHVGRDLRARHLDGVPWHRMAVLVRSQSQVDSLRRGLEMAGVPVRVSADDIPLREEPAVAVLLTALEAALAPTSITPELAVDLACGPLGRLDPGDLRVAGREMRRLHRAAAQPAPLPSAHRLVADALAATIVGEVDPWVAYADIAAPAAAPLARLRDLGRLLAEARAQAVAGALPGEVLWSLWSRTAWPERLRRAALGGHRPSGHDLDAVSALFDAAERFSDRFSGVAAVTSFVAALADQRVPAETVGDRGDDLTTVPLLTAHLAHGRSWEHVVIAGVQEGVWPPSGGGSSVLRVDEVDALVDGALDPALDRLTLSRRAAVDRLAEERRLFAHAIARAERSADIVAVASLRDAGEQPSRFIDDLGLEVTPVAGRPPRPLTLDGLVAELRSTAQAPHVSAGLRAAAAQRLALLVEEQAQGDPLVPLADPATWWGLEAATAGAGPIRTSIALSASALDGLQSCPRRWFLGHDARAEIVGGSGAAFGRLVHVLADGVARGMLPADPAVLEQYADAVWEQISFEAPWQSLAERDVLRAAIERFCHYHRSNGRDVCASEQPFIVTMALDAPEAETPVVLRGVIDRVEVDDAGRVFLVDLKTGRSTPTGPEVEEHAQLAVYQAAARAGALDAVLDGTATPGGASLVQLRHDATRSPGVAKVQEQQPMDDARSERLADDLAAAAQRLRAEDFPAMPSQDCRTCAYRRGCPAQEGEEVLP